MAWREYNPNPKRERVGDCAVRACCKATDGDWGETFVKLMLEGYIRADLPNANHVWGAYLRKNGFKRHIIPNECPDCYTVEDFGADHPKGVYVLATGNHAVCVQDGDWYDTWDSGGEVPEYYWAKGEG